MIVYLIAESWHQLSTTAIEENPWTLLGLPKLSKDQISLMMEAFCLDDEGASVEDDLGGYGDEGALSGIQSL